jgi:hypothetical protein
VDVSHCRTAHSCLSSPLPVYPVSLKPGARISPFPSFIQQIWHASVRGPNPVLQPQELLRSGRNISSFMSPFFRGEAIVMTSRHLFLHCCNPVYIWNRPSGSHDMGGGVNSIQICHLLLARPHLDGYRKYEIEFCSRTFPVIGQPISV